MNKLSKTDHVQEWSQDAFSIVIQKTGSKEVVQKAEQIIEKHYRLEIRDKFQNDQAVSSALIESKECLLNDGTFESIRGLVKSVLRAGTEEIFDRIIHELLEELNRMHSVCSSAYLVNRQDGKVLMPMSAKDIYTPPDYIGDDGKLHKSRPILHPAISAPLTMYAFEEGRKKEAIERSSSLAAVEHLIQGPESILERAKMLLAGQGIIVEQLTTGAKRTVEVGRERIDDMLQAPNYSFHRSHMYGSILAKKVLDLLKEYLSKTCDLQSIKLVRGSKEQFYCVELTVRVAPDLQV